MGRKMIEETVGVRGHVPRAKEESVPAPITPEVSDRIAVVEDLPAPAPRAPAPRAQALTVEPEIGLEPESPFDEPPPRSTVDPANPPKRGKPGKR